MIDILMSTYNGAPFLAEQIDSILEQDHREFRLLIRDDGSTDDTIKILANYAAAEQRVVLVEDDLGNLGASRSFIELISRTEADLFMLSDQDDVWLPDKISRTLAKIIELVEANGYDKPLAVFTDLTVVDEDLAVINESFWAYQKLDPSISLDWKMLLAQNVVTGCTLMMNKPAKYVILPFAIPEMMHDHWIAANVAKAGRIAYIAEPTVLYRQHGRNEEGAQAAGIAYLASKLPFGWRTLSLYRRAAKHFGGISAGELIKHKVKLNLKRLS